MEGMKEATTGEKQVLHSLMNFSRAENMDDFTSSGGDQVGAG